MAEALLSSYRLRPDARFLLAIGEVRRLVTQAPAGPITARFESGRWSVREGDSLVGTLPEIPSFSDGLSLATEYARRFTAPARGSAADARDADYLAEKAMAALVAKGEQTGWHGLTSSDAISALPLLARIVFQCQDRLGLADALGARAFAVLAIARPSNPAATRREEIMLAHAFGYTKHAADLAASLPPNDPLRLFLTGGDAPLKQIAEARGATEEARYLWLLRVTASHDLARWNDTRGRLFPQSDSLAVAATGLDPLIPIQVEVQGHRDDTAREIVARLDAPSPAAAGPEPFAVDGCQGAHGALWDRDTCATYFRAIYYSALDLPVSFEDYYHKPPIHPAHEGTELGRAFNAYTSVHTDDRRSVMRFLRDGGTTKAIGGVAVYSVTERLFETGSRDMPEYHEAGRILVSLLDSRPLHRAMTARDIGWYLCDLPQAERLDRSLLDEAGEAAPMLISKPIALFGDAAALKRVLHAPWISAEDAQYLLTDWCATRTDGVDEVEQEWTAALERFPDDWSLASAYVLSLRARERYEKACRVLERWIARNGPSTVGYYHAHVFQSYNYANAGEYQKGLDVVSPPNDLTKRRCASRNLNGLGRKQEAEEMARGVFREVPAFLDNSQNLAEILWQNGKFDEAAEVLSSAEARVSANDWWWKIGPTFERLFRKRSKDEATAALAALRKHHVPQMALWGLAAAAEGHGDHQRAFDLFSEIATTGTMNEDMLIEAFRSLKQARGPDEAFQWFSTLLPPERRAPFCVKAFYTREFELLWRFLQVDRLKDDDVRLIWLLRAAAVAVDDATRRAHLEETRAHFSVADGDPYHQIGRYLVGISTEDEFFSIAKTPALRCAVAFYEGVKKEGEGRYPEAVVWYRAAVDTDQTHEIGRHVALRTLIRWTDSNKPLATIAAGHL